MKGIHADDAWSKMPCSWQINPENQRVIRCAASTQPGEVIAALKLYIALCLKANYNKKEGLPSTGCVKANLTQLGKLVGMSRPMIIRGINMLERWGVIEKLGGRPAIYHIRDYESAPYWTKLPKQYLYGGYDRDKVSAILALPNRLRSTVDALQLYLYLAAVRDRFTEKAKVTYPKIYSVLHLDRNQISHAISNLTGSGLITVRLEDFDEKSKKMPCNAYWLRGSSRDLMRVVGDNARRKAGGKPGYEFESFV